MLWFNNKNKQDVCLIAETNKVSDDKLAVGSIHLECEDTAEAWGLDSRQQCKDEHSNRYIQFIGSLSCDPIKIYRNTNHTVETNTSLTASQTEDKEMVYTEREGSKHTLILWLGVCLSLLILTIAIIALVLVL